MSQLFVKVIRCFIHAIGTSDYANAESFLPHVNGFGVFDRSAWLVAFPTP